MHGRLNVVDDDVQVAYIVVFSLDPLLDNVQTVLALPQHPILNSNFPLPGQAFEPHHILNPEAEFVNGHRTQGGFGPPVHNIIIVVMEIGYRAKLRAFVFRLSANKLQISHILRRSRTSMFVRFTN